MKQSFGAAMAGIILMFLVTVMLPLMKSTEERYFPVVINAEITSTEVVDGKLNIHVEFDKIRGCKISSVDMTQLGRRVASYFAEDNGGEPLSRAIGHQDTGPWVLDTDTLDNLTITSIHNCHFLYGTRSYMYP